MGDRVKFNIIAAGTIVLLLAGLGVSLAIARMIQHKAATLTAVDITVTVCHTGRGAGWCEGEWTLAGHRYVGRVEGTKNGDSGRIIRGYVDEAGLAATESGYWTDRMMLFYGTAWGSLVGLVVLGTALVFYRPQLRTIVKLEGGWTADAATFWRYQPRRKTGEF